MTAAIDVHPALSAPEPQKQAQPHEQAQTEQEQPKVGCRRCAEVRHGGPSCN